ncbi:MAG: GGDEF domain-containing protein [Candidatus Omnitrophica bacterium]|nr:GGDEF domain-containing protein [Candidatus Omnitrophota bacterium]
MLSGLMIAGMFFLAAAGIKGGRDLVERYGEAIKQSGESKREEVGVLKQENAQIIDTKERLDRQSLTFSKIYETIKMMSEALKTEEIIGILTAFLNNNINFFESSLAIFSGALDGEIIKLYIMKKGDANFKEGPSSDIERRKEDLKDVIDTEKGQKNLSFVKEDITVIPLVVENKMTAALFVEDLDHSQLETFLILTAHLALELKKVSFYESVQRLSITDGLTEIYLMRYFLDRLYEETKRAARLKLNFSLLMIDIDHFKKTNDKYGHMVGDAALREIAAILKNNIREIDLVARYGGEEFTIFLPETERNGALYVAERIRKAIEAKTIKAYDESLKLTVSIGVSMYPDDTKDPNELIDRADKAMYESKRRGRNMVCAWQRKG